MKILLVFPPVASPVSPYLSVPLLSGQLKAKGYDVSALDLSVEFFNYILNSEFLSQSYKEAEKRLKLINESINNIENNTDEQSKYLLKKLSIQRKIIQKKFETDEENQQIIRNIDENIKKYRDKNSFYNLEDMKKTAKEVFNAFEIAMLPYAPAYCLFNCYGNPFYKMNYVSLKKQTEDIENNIFYEFFINKIKEYKIDEYDAVCVSIPNETQIMPALTLTRILKEKSKVKIVIGGNIISRIDKELKNIPEAFDIFYDYIIAGLGEKSLTQLMDILSGKSKGYNKVKGLIYKHNDKIYIEKPDLNYDINKSAIISLDGIKLDNYYTPDIIMPIQATKGCYWGKCSFCGLHYPAKKYRLKKPQNVVDEIEFLNKNYGIKIFEFIDEALHPLYLEKIADDILSRNLKIKYVCCARLENGIYSQKMCEKLYLSGLRLIEFGFETAVERLYKKLNKGIEFNNRLEIVELFAKSGIWTYIYAIIGYPSETKEEALKTINLAADNNHIIDTLFIHPFWLDKKAPIIKNYKKHNITKIRTNLNDIFCQKCSFDSDSGMNTKEINDLLILNNKNNPLSKYPPLFSPDEYFFLYVLHYGKDKLKMMLD